MDAAHLLPPLRAQPRDAYEWMDADVAFDSVTYRLGLRVLVPVPGLPANLDIAGARAAIVRGPVRAQHTNLRQRYGLPIVFDKHMTRERVGDGEFVLLLSLERAVSDVAVVEQSVAKWRAVAEGAAGSLTALLDERVAGEPLLEDVVLLRNGKAVAAADVRERVRAFLPLDVTTQDRRGLEQLADLRFEEGSGVARAARLLRRASLEGPTADAYVMLFVAAESVLKSRQPSKREFDEALSDAGLNPDGLPLHTGLLIGLRGQIVHEGLEDHEHLRMAFYEMEAIVRILIRRAAGLLGGWWPAHAPAAYATDFDDRVYARQGRRTKWHRRRLPRAPDPTDERIPRKVPGPSEQLVVRLDESVRQNTTQDAAALISSVVADAHAWVDPEGRVVTVFVGTPHADGQQADITFNADELWLAPARLEGLLDDNRPEVLVNFVWDLHGAVGSMVIMRAGIASEHDGRALIEAAGALHQYTRLILHGEYDAEALQLPPMNDPYEVGKVVGWAAAGDSRARAALDDARSEAGTLGRKLLKLLTRDPPFPPRPADP
jgi:hypothetical protein